MKKICFQFTFWSVLVLSIYAQQSTLNTANDKLYQKALGLYSQHEYTAAQSFFKQVTADKNSRIQANTNYYIAQTAVRLNQDNAEQLMLNFIDENPTHPKRNSAFFEVGNYYFNTGKYAKTRKWYQNVEISNLSSSERETYYFNLGYSLYTSKRYGKAEKNFKKIKESKKYGSQANYYLGFIAYKADDYTQADTYFEEIEEDSKLNKKLSYYKADRDFKQGKFQGAIIAAKEELPSSKPTEKSELNKIIGESHFNLKEYKQAIIYLEKYKGKNGRWSNTDHYLLGYAYYKSGNFIKAISSFNKIIGGKDAIAQNAYYHLADAYINLEKKQQALNAFKNAYELPYSPEIKKDAGYNYAKLSYEIGNSYESVPSVIRTYLVKYPNSYKEELSDLLIDSYFSSKNYKEALEVLEIDKNEKNNEIYQKVLFYRGLELIQEDNLKQAIKSFKKAVTINKVERITRRSVFWIGECYYKLGDFSKAIVAYNKLKDTNNDEILVLKDYQLGYSYFKLKNYKEAISSFEAFLETEPYKNYKEDAILRLADSHFAAAAYWPAMESYNKAISLNHPKADYAHYQKAISYGFVKRNEKKIEDLEAFLINFKRSNYRDDALLALANVYVAENKTRKGIENYQKLQRELPNSRLIPKAILKEGLIYYNQDKSDKAIERFKLVAQKYPKTSEAIQAVKSARLVYIDIGKTGEYANWVKTLDFVEISDEDLDNATYEAAEKQYLDGNSFSAISNFENYLKQFPNGLHNLESHFYLAQLYSKQEKNQKALPHYIEVSNQNKSEFTETALFKVSQTYLANKEYEKSISYLSRLEKEADFDQNLIFAKTNLMKAYNETQQYAKTLTYAEGVLKDIKVEASIKTDAQLYKARALLAQNKLEASEKAYRIVVKTATGKIGAEAIYNLAKFSNSKKKYETSNKYVQRLAKDFSTYREYGAKGLIIMAKNFYGLDDAYQASYVLSSIIKNFKQYPKVVSQAEVLLKKIKSEQAKVNSSIKE